MSVFWKTSLFMCAIMYDVLPVWVLSFLFTNSSKMQQKLQRRRETTASNYYWLWITIFIQGFIKMILQKQNNQRSTECIIFDIIYIHSLWSTHLVFMDHHLYIFRCTGLFYVLRCAWISLRLKNPWIPVFKKLLP